MKYFLLVRRAARQRATPVYRALGLFVAVVFVAGSAHVSQAQVGTCSSPTAESYLDINNVRARILNNGNLFWRGSPVLYEVPKGDGVSALFIAALWLGGKVDGDLRVAAAMYNKYEYWSGPLDDSGNPPADCSTYDYIWRIHRTDVEEYEAGQSATADLSSWPTGLGAPTLAPAADDGVDNDYDGEIDEPGEMRSITDDVLQQPLAQRATRVIDLESGERPEILGDQMLWWIMNDRGNAHTATGSTPLGVEVHARVFAFDQTGDLGNTTFYKYSIFYKGTGTLDSAFVDIFVDPDLGNFDDDYVGSDTTRHLAYAYNADNFDESSAGYGSAPPAVGFSLFEGPIVPSIGDTATLSGSRIPDSRNLGMTAFVEFPKGGAHEPMFAQDYYNYMRGTRKDGSPIRVGQSEYYDAAPGAPVTTFMYTGDPASGSFWTEFNSDGNGNANPPADRRMVSGTGPFTMTPGDRQDVAFGIVWGRGESHLDSVNKIRNVETKARAAYDALYRPLESSSCTAGLFTEPLDYANVQTTLVNSGQLFADVYEVPAGSGIHAIPFAGIWLGAEIDGGVRTSVAARSSDPQFFNGPLNEVGRPVEDCDMYNRIWTVSVEDLEAYETSGTTTPSLAGWPTGLGAPTLDAAGNLIDVMDEPIASRKDRVIDLDAGERPALQGHEMSWWILNDVGDRDPFETLGLEIHNLVFTVAVDGPLANTTFYRHRLFYRGGGTLQNAYVGVHSEVDLGNLEGSMLGTPDDYVGSDSTSGLAFAYNADDVDENGYSVFPAAVGYQFLRGPAVPSPGSTAWIGEVEVPDYKNLSMTSFLAYESAEAGPTGIPQNAEQRYNYLHGVWKDGAPITMGNVGRDEMGTPTTFMWPGEPPGYWSELNIDDAGTPNEVYKRSLVASSGPFDMTSGDEQEISYAIVWANGNSSLDALAELKSAAATVVDAFESGEYPDADFVRQPVSAVVPEQVFVDMGLARDTTVTIQIQNVGGGYLRWSAVGDIDPPITNILVTANAAGPLDPPEYGAFDINGSGFPHPTTAGMPVAGRQQANSDAVWGIHTGGGSYQDFDDFIDRIRPSDLLGRDDYEIRFTSRGGLGVRRFDDNAQMSVPFELWRIGLAALEDPSDDIRLVPVILEEQGGLNYTFNISGDHSISALADDPYTDWIYFYEPVDLTPGEAGYELFTQPPYPYGEEILGRIVMVSLDGGSASPYDPPLPEEGTVFQIHTGKSQLVDTSPGEGAIGPMSSADLRIDLSTLTLPGTYVETVQVETSDPNYPTVEVQVILEVGSVGTDETTTGGRQFTLRAVYPNPTTGEAHVRFENPAQARVRAELFDVLGRRVMVLYDEDTAPGEHTIRSHVGHLSGGVYFVRLTSGSTAHTTTLVVAR